MDLQPVGVLHATDCRESGAPCIGIGSPCSQRSVRRRQAQVGRRGSRFRSSCHETADPFADSAPVIGAYGVTDPHGID